jgi:hypothetical protein
MSIIISLPGPCRPYQQNVNNGELLFQGAKKLPWSRPNMGVIFWLQPIILRFSSVSVRIIEKLHSTRVEFSRSYVNSLFAPSSRE